MKYMKIALVPVLVLYCSTVQAIDCTRGLIESCDCTPIQISLCPPIQVFSSGTGVCGLRLNMLVGYNSKVTGLDIGTMVNETHEMNGVQIAFFNQATRWSGIQVGFGNVGGFLGPPNIRRIRTDQDGLTTHSQGIQIGIMNCVGRYSPMSPADAPAGVFSGLQLGIMNFADEMKGGQIAAVINSANNVTGLQIGIINTARILNGVQIGLINRADNGVLMHPFPGEAYGLPIINMAFE